MKLKHIAMAASATIALVSTAATAQSTVPVKLSSDVRETINLISVNISGRNGVYTAAFTYEMLKSCRSFLVGGHAYKDDIQGGAFTLGEKMNVTAGQKV